VTNISATHSDRCSVAQGCFEPGTARDEAVLRDLERDLSELEQQYQMASEEFFQRWQADEMADIADFMDWNALYQMACEVRERLNSCGARLKRYDH
jgi:hypothetical protein